MDSIKPNRFSAVLSGTSTVVYYNGKRTAFSFESEQENESFYAEINKLHKQGEYNALKDVIDPARMFDVSDYLQKDRGGNYFVKGISIPVPNELLVKMKKFMELGIDISPLVNFWKLLSTNPDEHVRTSLFKFAERFSFPITDSGYFIAYKSVAWKGTSYISYALKVSNAYIEVVANGKSPKDYGVFSHGDSESISIVKNGEETDKFFMEILELYKELDLFPALKEKFSNPLNVDMLYKLGELENDIEQVDEFLQENHIDFDIVAKAKERYKMKYEGTLGDVYADLLKKFSFGDQETFTDWHTRKSTIVLGKAVSMPRYECDNDPSQTCSSGLHVGAPGYVQSFGRGENNYILACLVSPANVVAVPYDYNFEKMRVCEYFPFAICEMKDGEVQEVKTPYFENDYMSEEKEYLERKLIELEEKRLSSKGGDEKELAQEVTAFESRLIHLRTILQNS
jgi:hypothetical protein